jgi:hypothetical protein
VADDTKTLPEIMSTAVLLVVGLRCAVHDPQSLAVIPNLVEQRRRRNVIGRQHAHVLGLEGRQQKAAQVVLGVCGHDGVDGFKRPVGPLQLLIIRCLGLAAADRVGSHKTSRNLNLLQ